MVGFGFSDAASLAVSMWLGNDWDEGCASEGGYNPAISQSLTCSEKKLLQFGSTELSLGPAAREEWCGISQILELCKSLRAPNKVAIFCRCCG